MSYYINLQISLQSIYFKPLINFRAEIDIFFEKNTAHFKVKKNLKNHWYLKKIRKWYFRGTDIFFRLFLINFQKVF